MSYVCGIDLLIWIINRLAKKIFNYDYSMRSG